MHDNSREPEKGQMKSKSGSRFNQEEPMLLCNPQNSKEYNILIMLNKEISKTMNF